MPEETAFQRSLASSWAGSVYANFPFPKMPFWCAFSHLLTISSLLATALQPPIAPTSAHPLGSVLSWNSPFHGLLALKLSVISHYLLQKADSQTHASPQGCRNESLCKVRHVHPHFPLQLDGNGAVLPPRSCHQLWDHQMREPLTYLGARKTARKEVFHRNQGSPASAEHFGKEMPRVQDISRLLLLLFVSP